MLNDRLPPSSCAPHGVTQAKVSTPYVLKCQRIVEHSSELWMAVMCATGVLFLTALTVGKIRAIYVLVPVSCFIAPLQRRA